MIREIWLRRLASRTSLSSHSFVFLGSLRALVVNFPNPAGAIRKEKKE
jgi:hypothetical protein